MIVDESSGKFKREVSSRTSAVVKYYVTYDFLENLKLLDQYYKQKEWTCLWRTIKVLSELFRCEHDCIKEIEEYNFPRIIHDCLILDPNDESSVCIINSTLFCLFNVTENNRKLVNSIFPPIVLTNVLINLLSHSNIKHNIIFHIIYNVDHLVHEIKLVSNFFRNYNLDRICSLCSCYLLKDYSDQAEGFFESFDLILTRFVDQSECSADMKIVYNIIKKLLCFRSENTYFKKFLRDLIVYCYEKDDNFYSFNDELDISFSLLENIDNVCEFEDCFMCLYIGFYSEKLPDSFSMTKVYNLFLHKLIKIEPDTKYQETIKKIFFAFSQALLRPYAHLLVQLILKDVSIIDKIIKRFDEFMSSVKIEAIQFICNFCKHQNIEFYDYLEASNFTDILENCYYPFKDFICESELIQVPFLTLILRIITTKGVSHFQSNYNIDILNEFITDSCSSTNETVSQLANMINEILINP